VTFLVSEAWHPAQAILPKEANSRVFTAIGWLETEYPGFSDWYWDTVVPGVLIGERRISTIERRGRTVGVGISKRTKSERKMCTIWVAPDFIGTGMGVRLMLDSMKWLGTNMPLATVSESRLQEFKPIMDKLGYQLTQVLPDYYKAGHSEFVFNGSLIVNA
jgi:hypothetical protein